MRRFGVLVPCFLLLGCSTPDRPLAQRMGMALGLADGTSTTLGTLMGREGTVLVALDPDCPISQLYAPLLDSLSTAYHGCGVAFIGFHPAAQGHAHAVQGFAQAAGLSFPQVLDSTCALTTVLDARVMPEVFVLDAAGAVRYQGALDDRAVRAGRKKPMATRHYLRDALHGLCTDTTIDPPQAQAVGCIIECVAP